MARYTDSVCRICRREGIKLFFKSERCHTTKCSFERRAYAPGQHGQGRSRKPSEYAIQLREKQKARRMYGVLEKQFRRYFAVANRQKGMTGENLLRILERRLDNVVYRLGLAGSRPEARQLITHGHYTVNGRRVDIASYLVNAGDVIAIKEKSRSINRLKEMAENLGSLVVPAWMSVDADVVSGTIIRLPDREDIQVPIEEQLIVERYSR
ncbi:MAG: 30S ribosomal protein S4 [Peptococcaceae bacterium]|jgi:small subunit ribosomal protein S4|nr:30S ribosomal protein S4 [Peptococcaceae bacterium]